MVFGICYLESLASFPVIYIWAMKNYCAYIIVNKMIATPMEMA